VSLPQEGANLYLQLCDKVRDDVLPALGVLTPLPYS